jgi:hypothetical protein
MTSGTIGEFARVTLFVKVNQMCVGGRVPMHHTSRSKKEQMKQEVLISCAEVRRELSNYIDDEVTPELRMEIEKHVSVCLGCKAIYDGVRKVLTLVSTTQIIELPRGFSARLYRRLLNTEAD